MDESMPTLEEWRRLYDAAIRVKGIAFRLKPSDRLRSLDQAKEFLLQRFT